LKFCNFIAVQYFTVTEGSSTMSKTHTLRWVWNGSYPVVERYYLLLQINATSGHLCRFDVWLKSLYIIILAINKLVSQIGKIPDKIICPLISTQLSSAIYLHDLLGSYLVVYSTFLNDHHISTYTEKTKTKFMQCS
jgi:hypothetical protein